MSILKDRFAPIKLPPDEKIILRKRESLRTRGIAWLAGLTWLLSLFAAGVILLIAETGGSDVATAIINGALIILMISLLPAALFVFLKWLAGTYQLDQSEIKMDDNLATRILAVKPVALDLRQVDHVEAVKPTWPGKLFNLGDVVLSTRREPAALTVSAVERPRFIAEEIGRRVKLAHARARAGQEATIDETIPPMEIRRSGAWLMLMWLPLMQLTGSMVMAWFVLGLAESFSVPALLTFVTIVGTISIIILIPWWLVSFFRWWLRIYVVTDRRVIQREGIMNITRRVLSLDDVVTATAIKAGIGRFIDVGHVQVMTAGLSGDIVMSNISAPDYVRQRVLETQEQIRQYQEQLELSDISNRLQVMLRL